MKRKPPKWLGRVWAWRGAFEAHIPSRDRSWQGYWVPPPLPLPPTKPVREEGPPLLTCQLQRACLLLPQSFDTKIVQEASVLKMPQQTLIPGIEGGKRKKEAGKRKHRRTRVLLGKKGRGKIYRFRMIAQHRSMLQTTQAIQLNLDQQINLCIKIIQTDLALGDRMKKKGVKGPYGRVNTGLLWGPRLRGLSEHPVYAIFI